MTTETKLFANVKFVSLGDIKNHIENAASDDYGLSALYHALVWGDISMFKGDKSLARRVIPSNLFNLFPMDDDEVSEVIKGKEKLVKKYVYSKNGTINTRQEIKEKFGTIVDHTICTFLGLTFQCSEMSKEEYFEFFVEAVRGYLEDKAAKRKEESDAKKSETTKAYEVYLLKNPKATLTDFKKEVKRVESLRSSYDTMKANGLTGQLLDELNEFIANLEWVLAGSPEVKKEAA